MSRVLCSIYKSSKKDEMYLYVPKATGLSAVPEGLMQMFGTPRHVTDLFLVPERKLARADIAQVLDKLASQQFYLQMPPAPELLNGHAQDAPAWRRRSGETDEPAPGAAT